MAIYESEHTRFMRDWMARHPEAKEAQKQGRALWWDKPQSPERQREVSEARVPTRAYYYDPSH